jgi:TorA maturation chaperone TorD
MTRTDQQAVEADVSMPVEVSNEALSRPLLITDMLRRLFLFGPNEAVLGLALAAADAKGGSASLASTVVALCDAIEEGIDGGEKWMSDLAVEWTRLIVGPAQTPAVPYASFYLTETRLVMTEETLAVRRQYLEAGLALHSDVRLPDDHLGIELDFLYFLEREIVIAEALGDVTKVTGARARCVEFVDGHLAQWVPRFASDLSGATTFAFVQAVVASLLALLSDAGNTSQG